MQGFFKQSKLLGMIRDGVLLEQSLDDLLDRRLGCDVEVLYGVLRNMKSRPLALRRSTRRIPIGAQS